MKKIVIWFSWEMWCWKDTSADYLFSKYSWEKLKFSKALRDVLARIWVEAKRENLQELSSMLRVAFWQDLLAKIIYNDAISSKENIVLIDWVRRPDDIKYLMKLPYFKLVYIEASMEKRFERIIKRWENLDDNDKTFEQFKKEHTYEAESQIKTLKPLAHHVIDNNWDFEDLYKQIDEIIKM